GHTRLGAGERANRLAPGEWDQPLLLLSFGAKVEDRRAAQGHTCTDRDGHRRVHSGELFHGDAKSECAGAEAAVLLGERQAHNAEVTEFLDCLDWERAFAVPAPSIWRYFCLGELADGSPQRPLVVRQLEVHCAVV